MFALQGRHYEAQKVLLAIVQQPTTPFATTRMMYYQDLAKQYVKLGAMKQITINGNNIHNIASFYAEINRVFMAEEQWQIGNSLDAFNDLLYGGFGAIKGDEKIQLLWSHIEQCKAALGYETTKAYYEGKLKAGSPFNQEYFQEKLTALEQDRGETYFDILMAIIAEHPNIELLYNDSENDS